MNYVDGFRVGFWFGVQVAKSMGFDADPMRVLDQLRSIRRGKMTLMPSPDEAISEFRREFEREFGHVPTDKELNKSCQFMN